jgi:ornithine cyclodeaminase/alanine dehydrogenase-like protein (mu-crystallin family)
MTMSRALTILTGSQVDKIISKLDLEAALTSQAQVFKAFSAQKGSDNAASPPIQTPLRSKITSSSATSLFMPSRVAAIDTTACKIVSIPQGGSQDGLPGTTVVLDSEGNTRGIVNARKLTALRNAAGE